MKSLLLSIVTVCIISSVWAKCPKVKPMENFKDKDLIGHWYVVAQTNRSGLQSNYPLEKNEEMEATKKGVNWTIDFTGVDANNGTKYNYTAVGPQIGKAFLNLTMYCPEARRNYNHDITILGSDKKNFIVLFSCNFPNPNQGYYWVYSRTKGVTVDKLPLKQQIGISNILTANGFSPFEIRYVKHTG